MTSFSYGTPGGSGNNPPRKRCWGDKNAYDYTSRECRGCEDLASCGEQITRIRNAQQSYQQPGLNSYGNAYTSPYAPRTVANPLPQYTQQAPLAAPQVAPTVRPAPLPVSQQPTAMTRQPTGMPAAAEERYGWYYDPLYHQVASMPPPIRPQFQGESFVERVGKNMFLSALEAIGMQGVLGIRQLVLPPKSDDEE